MEVNIEHMPVSLEHDGLKDAVVCVNSNFRNTII